VIGGTGIQVYGESSGSIVNCGAIIGTSKDSQELLEYLCKLKEKSAVSEEAIFDLAEKMGVDYTCFDPEYFFILIHTFIHHTSYPFCCFYLTSLYFLKRHLHLIYAAF